MFALLALRSFFSLARAERMLLDHLEPYLHYAPGDRLTKFSAATQVQYEPEARSELAMAYLLHYGRDQIGGGWPIPQRSRPTGPGAGGWA